MSAKKANIKNRYRTPEALSETFEGLKKTAKTEGRQFGKGFFKQLLGLNSASEKAAALPKQEASKGNAHNEIFSASKHNAEKQQQKKPERLAPAMHYSKDIEQNRERFSRKETNEIKQQLSQIEEELKRLILTSKVLEMQFSHVAVNQKPVSVGKYHLNYFKFLLHIVQEARKNAEDANTWLSAAKGKNNKKGYWNQAKGGKNTHFTMSMDRNVATQTG